LKRLVYTPRVDVFVKTDSGIYDLSPYVTSCSVNRQIDAVSTAEVEFRNPQFIWTDSKTYDSVSKTSTRGPIFHPMDPIVITMTRIKDRPMQVFTGFCDTTPYIQLFPGTCKIKASCTIKRLLYTYFDPGLPFVWEFLQSHGWQVNAQLGGITNPQEETAPAKKFRPDGTPYVKQTDGSIGGLLFDTLIEIGGWSDETIFIESLPDGIVDTVENIYKEMALTAEASARADLNYFLEGALGGGSYGSALDNGGGDSGDNNVQDAELQGLDRVYPENGSDVLDPSQVFSIAKYVGFSEKDAKLFRRVAFAESSLKPGLVNSIGCEGLWQIYVKVHPDLVRLHGDMRNPFNNAKAALSLFKSGGMQPWESSRNAGDGGGWGKYR